MRINRRGITALAAVMAAGLVSVDSYGAVMSYTSKKSNSAEYSEKYEAYEDDGEYEEKYGPGYVSEEEEEKKYLDEEEETTGFSGPGVNKVSLQEQYHEDYKVYEQSIADLFFLYTTVSNGGMTDEAVTIDIPANVLYTMEKDGTEIGYTSGQAVRERGTYVLRLTAVENPELPLSEQTEYQAVFRFRIQDKPPVEKEETRAALSWNDSEVLVYVEEPEETAEYQTEEETPEETESLEETEVFEEETEEESSEEESSEEEISLEETESSEVQTEETAPTEPGPEVTVTVKGGTAEIQYLSDDIEETVLEKDGEVLEEFYGTTITEPGRYRLTVKDSEGNETVQEFTLKYKMNGYGVMAIVLCIAVIAGIAAFVIHTKKNMKIR